MSQPAFFNRLSALIRKEVRQMLRDKSNLAVGLLLPISLILLFGYGLSLDVKNAAVAVVMEDTSPVAYDAMAGLRGTAYLSPTFVFDMHTAEQLMAQQQVSAILRVPQAFSRQLSEGHAQLQLILNGVDSSVANALEGYVNGAIAAYAEHRADRMGEVGLSGGIQVLSRTWFNEANNSTWYLVPGLMVLILTLIGAFLTSLLIAREWERGTLESLFVTPVRPLELLVSKLVPYFCIGAVDIVMCLLASRFLFQVPIRGSLVVIGLASLLYLVISLLTGLMISGITRSQFQASQLALLASFMPAMMLSGFMFDLRNVPSIVYAVSQVLPATHFMELIKTLFLTGNYWPTILRDIGVLSLYVPLLGWGTYRQLRKTLD